MSDFDWKCKLCVKPQIYRRAVTDGRNTTPPMCYDKGEGRVARFGTSCPVSWSTRGLLTVENNGSMVSGSGYEEGIGRVSRWL